MARGGPADFFASRELQEASVALRIVYLELRPHRDARQYPVVTSVADALSAAAMGARVRLTTAEAMALVDEGLALQLFTLGERKREDGVEGVETVLGVVALPPSVYRVRYGDRRGPKGGLSAAERKKVSRDKKAREGGERESESPGESDDADTTGAVKRIDTALEGSASTGAARDSNRDVTDDVTEPVTAIRRDTSRTNTVTAPGPGVSSSPPPGTPFRGGPGEGGGDTPPKGSTRPERQGWEETGAWALKLLAEGTAKALDASAVAPQRRHLGRAVIDRKIGAPELELVSAWLREVPTAWRTVLPKSRGLLLTVEHLLGEKVDNIFTGSGLQALLVAAREWDRRRASEAPPRQSPKAPAGPGPVVAGEPSRFGGLTREEFKARSGG